MDDRGPISRSKEISELEFVESGPDELIGTSIIDWEPALYDMDGIYLITSEFKVLQICIRRDYYGDRIIEVLKATKTFESIK